MVKIVGAKMFVPRKIKSGRGSGTNQYLVCGELPSQLGKRKEPFQLTDHHAKMGQSFTQKIDE